MLFCVAHDVTERARIEEALREAKNEADRANHAKSEFLSRMSHELRTPLNAILGFGQLLERQNPTPQQRARVDHIMSAGRHLLNLINEVLDISRIEAGHLQLSRRAGGVARGAGGSARSHAATRGGPRDADFGRAQPEKDLHVLADRQRLKQVLLNLLTNAVKYTAVGGRVDGFGRAIGFDEDARRRYRYRRRASQRTSWRACLRRSIGSTWSNPAWKAPVSASPFANV